MSDPRKVSRKEQHAARLDAIRKGGKRVVGYIKEQQGSVVSAVLCKGCGATIRKMVSSDNSSHISVRKVGDVIVREAPMVMVNLPNYVEIEFECDDGSRHVTNCCTSCAPTLTADDLDDFLVIDTEQLVKEENAQGRQMPPQFFDMLTSRKVQREKE